MAASSPSQGQTIASVLKQRVSDRDNKDDALGALDKWLDQCKQAIADVKKDMTSLTRENQRLKAKVERSNGNSKQVKLSFAGDEPPSESEPAPVVQVVEEKPKPSKERVSFVIVEESSPAAASVDEDDRRARFEPVVPGSVTHNGEAEETEQKERADSPIDSLAGNASSTRIVPRSESETERQRVSAGCSHMRGSTMSKHQATIDAMLLLTQEEGYFYISPKWKDVQKIEPARLSTLASMSNHKSRKTMRTKVTWVQDSSVAISEVLAGNEPEVADTVTDPEPVKACPRLISPDEPLRGFWDIFSVVLVLYDIVVLPLQLLDLPEDNEILIFMSWVARIFWTLDIAMSVCSGYVLPNGAFVMDLKMIVRRYLKTWFLLDAVIVGIDWSELFMPEDEGDSTASSAARFSKASRGVRALRMLRLLRLLRIGNGLMIQGLFAVSALASEKMQLAGEILKIVLCLMMLSHVTGCLWFGVGASLSASSMASWVDVNSLQASSVGEKYITCLHWSLSFLQGGMDEFPPRNPLERCYAVIILIITFLVSMGFLSRLTSSLTQLHIITSEHEVGLRMLRTYLSQNSISGKLAARISRSVKHSLSNVNQTIGQEEVKLLAHVSAHLRSELYFEIYGTLLSHHFFFQKYIEECPQVMRKVCRAAVDASCIASGDLVFSDGERPESPVMYVVESGSLVYLAYTGRTAVVSNMSKKVYDSSHFIAEGALWTAWVHMGMLKAASPVNLYEVDANKFQNLACEFHHTEFDPRVYAINFIKLLNWSVAEDIEVTDLAMPTSEEMLTLDFDPEEVFGNDSVVGNTLVPDL